MPTGLGGRGSSRGADLQPAAQGEGRGEEGRAGGIRIPGSRPTPNFPAGCPSLFSEHPARAGLIDRERGDCWQVGARLGKERGREGRGGGGLRGKGGEWWRGGGEGRREGSNRTLGAAGGHKPCGKRVCRMKQLEGDQIQPLV